MKKEIRQFNHVYALLSITNCMYSTFIMFYLKEKGFSITELGLFSSINIAAAILGQFIWGYLSDAMKTIKKLFIFNLGVLVFVAMVMQLTSRNVVVVLCIMAFGFFQGPLSVLLESWVLSGEKEISRNFGSIRAWSSIGWAFCALIMGIIIKRVGWNALFIFYGIFAVFTLLATKNIKDRSAVKEKSRNSVNPFTLFRDYRYVFVVFIMLLLSIAQQTLSFLYLKVNALGGNATHVGIISFVMAMCELPVFFGAKYLIKKFKLIHLLLFCSVMYGVRMILLSMASSYTGIILLGGLQIFTFAIYVIAYKYLIVEIAPSHLQISAQSTASSVCAMGGILFGIIAGYIIDKRGIDALFHIGAIASFIAVVLLLLYTTILRKTKPRME